MLIESLRLGQVFAMFITTQVPQDEQILKLVPIMAKASQILLEEYQNYCDGQAFNIERKNDESPVTQADLRVNTYLIEQLAKITPELPVLSEESDNTERHMWEV